MKIHPPPLDGVEDFIQSLRRAGTTSSPSRALRSLRKDPESPQFSYEDPSNAGQRETRRGPYYVMSSYVSSYEGNQEGHRVLGIPHTLHEQEHDGEINEVAQNATTNWSITEEPSSAMNQPGEGSQQEVREGYREDDDLYGASDEDETGQRRFLVTTRRNEARAGMRPLGRTNINTNGFSRVIEQNTSPLGLANPGETVMTVDEFDQEKIVDESDNLEDEESNEDSTPYGQGPGVVSHEKGKMWYCEKNKDGAKLQEAVYHKDIRAQLIAAAATKGQYDFPREAGLDINDVTSYLAAQKTWNVDDRAHRPKILFQWAKTGHRNPTYVVSDWYYEGKIVLDLKNCPVRKFCNIPETCSSALEGGIMEAIEREDSRIGHQDFIARMPPRILVKKGKDHQAKPIYGMNALSQRMRRFREKACCIVWGARAGSDKIREYLKTLLPPQCIADNSTENFRDLHEHERAGIRLLNAGKFSERAGDRAIDDVDRKARAKKVKDSIERRKERFEKGITPEKNPNHNKRKRVATRDAATEDESDKEVPDFAAGTGTFGRTKKSRKTSHTENTGTSRKRKTSETDWEDEAFVDELGADGDDENPKPYDMGCANPNAHMHLHQTKRPKLSNAGHHRPSLPYIVQGRNTDLPIGQTFQGTSLMAENYSAGVEVDNREMLQSSAAATPLVHHSVPSLPEFQPTDEQEPYDADTVYVGSSNAANTSTVDTSAVNTVSVQTHDNLLHAPASHGEMFNFDFSYFDNSVTSSNSDPSSAASQDDDYFDFHCVIANSAETAQFNADVSNNQWNPSWDAWVEVYGDETETLGAHTSIFEDALLSSEGEDKTPSSNSPH